MICAVTDPSRDYFASFSTLAENVPELTNGRRLVVGSNRVVGESLNEEVSGTHILILSCGSSQSSEDFTLHAIVGVLNATCGRDFLGESLASFPTNGS